MGVFKLSSMSFCGERAKRSHCQFFCWDNAFMSFCRVHIMLPCSTYKMQTFPILTLPFIAKCGPLNALKTIWYINTHIDPSPSTKNLDCPKQVHEHKVSWCKEMSHGCYLLLKKKFTAISLDKICIWFSRSLNCDSQITNSHANNQMGFPFAPMTTRAWRDHNILLPD